MARETAELALDLGFEPVFNLNATISHDVEVGDFCTVSSGTNISGCVVIGAGCTIGASTQINQGTWAHRLRTGQGTTIGAGTVVIADCADHAVYAGVPVKKIR